MSSNNAGNTQNTIPNQPDDSEPDDSEPDGREPDARSGDVVERIARRSLERRGADYASEVRRLLDAALTVMRQCGTRSRPRVADIVAAAGLSNEAFYRHFPSKDALVTAILEDVALSDQEAATSPTEMRQGDDRPGTGAALLVEGSLAQADEEIAATTLAVLWNGGSVGGGPAAGRHFANAPLAELLFAPFEALGSDDPDFDAPPAAHATWASSSADSPGGNECALLATRDRRHHRLLHRRRGPRSGRRRPGRVIGPSHPGPPVPRGPAGEVSWTLPLEENSIIVPTRRSSGNDSARRGVTR